MHLFKRWPSHSQSASTLVSLRTPAESSSSVIILMPSLIVFLSSEFDHACLRPVSSRLRTCPLPRSRLRWRTASPPSCSGPGCLRPALPRTPSCRPTRACMTTRCCWPASSSEALQEKERLRVEAVGERILLPQASLLHLIEDWLTSRFESRRALTSDASGNCRTHKPHRGLASWGSLKGQQLENPGFIWLPLVLLTIVLHGVVRA